MIAIMSILVTGSTAYDVLLGYDGSFADAIDAGSLDTLSVSFFSPRFAKHHGGTGANIAWNIKLLGGDPLLVSTVGSDGAEYKALLTKRGIDTAYLEVCPDAVTATAIICTDTSERQIAFFHPGADGLGTFPDLTDRRKEISYAIVAPRNALLMMEAVHRCEKLCIPYLFDPGQQIIALSNDELLFGIQHASGVITNCYEWELLSGRLHMAERDVLAFASMLIVTRGEHGALCHTKDGTLEVAACKAKKLINPTGAGDGFRAGLLMGIASGWSVRDAVRLGNAVGSMVVEIEGTLLDTLDLEALRARAEETYGEKLPLYSQSTKS